MKYSTFTVFAILLLISCGNAQTEVMPVMSTGNIECDQPAKITAIYREWVYDLSGYRDVAGGDPFFLFDENDKVDPLNNITNYKPSTDPHPRVGGDMYFKKGIGSRIVVDLGTEYDIAHIFLMDAASTADSIYIYAGSLQDPVTVAAFTANGRMSSSNWKQFDISVNTRYLVFQFNGPAKITEAVLYGCRTGAEVAAPAKNYTGPVLPPKTLKDFLGVNCYQGTPMQFMEPFSMSRLYMNNSRIDIAPESDYPGNIRYNIVPNGWWNNGTGDYVLYDDSVKMARQRIWYSFLGVPKWMEEKGLHNHDFPVTTIGMKTTDPLSYGRHANMLWNMAAAYGSKKVDTHQIQAVNDNRFSGRNTMTIFENGNEVDAYWEGERYWYPLEYFAMSSADYDGHEGALGARHGIKYADPDSELMMAGLVTLDLNRVRVLNFLSKHARKDHSFIWKGGVQYHYYSTNGKGDLPGEKFFQSTGGLTPEQDSLRKKLAYIREQTYLLEPSVECILGEYGYDKNQKSKVAAPIVDGLPAAESQAIMLLRATNAIFFSGFDRYIIYWIKDNEPETQEATYLTSGLLKVNDPGQIHTPYPSWYFINTYVHYLGDYQPEAVVQESGDVWVYKYVHAKNPAQKAYFIYQPVTQTKKNISYTLPVKTSQATVVNFNISPTGTAENLQAKNNQVTVAVSAIPVVVLTEEDN